MRPVEKQDHHDGLGLNDALTILVDERDPACGNASHKYRGEMVTFVSPEGDIGTRTVVSVDFQHGARNLPDSTPGAADAALLTILLDRYRGFQAGPFACRENALVITKLEEALLWMKHRAFARHAQGVLGKNEAHK